jgi:hypothetical protein
VTSGERRLPLPGGPGGPQSLERAPGARCALQQVDQRLLHRRRTRLAMQDVFIQQRYYSCSKQKGGLK